MKNISIFLFCMKKTIPFFVVLITLFACNNNKTEQPKPKIAEKEIVEKQHNIDTVSIKFEVVNRDVPIQQIVYLIKDVDVMAAPTDDAKQALSFFSYLRLCSVIDEVGEWYAVLDSVFVSEFIEEEEQFDMPVYRKVYIKKNATAPITDYKLKKEDFAIFTYESTDGNEVLESVYEDVMTFELISEVEFQKQRRVSVDFIKHDTASVRKINGTLKLPCKNKTLVLKDERGSDAEPEKTNIYTYIGRIDLLNAYLVYVEFFEEDGYNIYDKNTGKLIDTFDSYPVISPNKKYIADIYANPFDLTTDFSLYQLSKDGKFRPYYDFSFRKWSPYSDGLNHNNDYFWGANNTIYVKTINMDISGYPYLDLSAAIQYLKIKIA